MATKCIFEATISCYFANEGNCMPILFRMRGWNGQMKINQIIYSLLIAHTKIYLRISQKSVFNLHQPRIPGPTKHSS